MKRFQFSIRELLLLMAIAAVSFGWWLDHRRLSRDWPVSEFNRFAALESRERADREKLLSITNPEVVKRMMENGELHQIYDDN